jgi:hypothetical protein
MFKIKTIAFCLCFCLVSAVDQINASDAESGKLTPSRGDVTYYIDPGKGDDANPPGQPWRSFGKLNSIRLAAGDQVIIAPGLQQETLKPSGEGTADKPVVIKFLPGVHTINIKNVLHKQLFISNSIDSTEPIPVGIMLSQVKHFRLLGGGVDGVGKTTLLYEGRMMQILNENAEDVEYSGLVIDMKRTAVSEIRVLEAQDSMATIQVAEGSDYQVENGRFFWRGDWLGGGLLAQEFDLKSGRCWRSGAPRGWTSDGQTEANATDLGERKVKLEFPNGACGLTTGRHYHFRNIKRVMAGVHTTRSARIAFRDCDVYALPCMGFVSQFTDTMTFQRVNVAPPANSIRTCPAWADIFQFSNCKGDILVDSCRLSGMQDDALNCHGTHLRIVEKTGDQQLLARFIQPQTYGFAAYAPGDEIAVINHANLCEYPGNPRAKVVAVEMKSPTDWLLTLAGPMPFFGKDDVLDNITWNPNITIRNNHVSVNPVRGFLLGSRGKIIVEGNTFERCANQGILVEGDAAAWMESSPIRDLLIQGNRFINCGISVEPSITTRKSEEPVHGNIRIQNNRFEESCQISIKSARGVGVIGNHFIGGPIQITLDPSCTETRVENND